MLGKEFPPGRLVRRLLLGLSLTAVVACGRDSLTDPIRSAKVARTWDPCIQQQNCGNDGQPYIRDFNENEAQQRDDALSWLMAFPTGHECREIGNQLSDMMTGAGQFFGTNWKMQAVWSATFYDPDLGYLVGETIFNQQTVLVATARTDGEIQHTIVHEVAHLVGYLDVVVAGGMPYTADQMATRCGF